MEPIILLTITLFALIVRGITGNAGGFFRNTGFWARKEVGRTWQWDLDYEGNLPYEHWWYLYRPTMLKERFAFSSTALKFVTNAYDLSNWILNRILFYSIFRASIIYGYTFTIWELLFYTFIVMPFIVFAAKEIINVFNPHKKGARTKNQRNGKNNQQSNGAGQERTDDLIGKSGD